jgi:hypothetical protein
MKFLTQNQILTILALAWTLPWKEVALWKAAQNDDKVWLLHYFLVNPLAILEILYIFIFINKKLLQKQ